MKAKWFRMFSLVLVLAVAFAAVAPAAAQPSKSKGGGNGGPVEQSPNGVYIVQMINDPVVAYTGDVPGYPATKPPKGQKIDPNDKNVIKYAGYLKGKHDEALNMVAGKKLYDYVYSFNGFAAQMSVEQANSVKGGPPRHLHYDQDELWYVLDGDYVVEIGSERHLLKPGDCILGPRRIPHAWAFVGDTRGRLLIAFTPAGKMQENFERNRKPGEYRSDAEIFQIRQAIDDALEIAAVVVKLVAGIVDAARLRRVVVRLIAVAETIDHDQIEYVCGREALETALSIEWRKDLERTAR